VVRIRSAGRSFNYGSFDDARAAGERADKVWKLLGAPEKCNFDDDGNPTGSHESAASRGQVNVTIHSVDSRQSKFEGVVTDKARLESGQKAYRAQVSVPDCRLKNYACPSEDAGAKCACKPLHRKRSTRFYTQVEAARAWNELVVDWGLHEESRVEPLVLNRL